MALRGLFEGECRPEIAPRVRSQGNTPIVLGEKQRDAPQYRQGISFLANA